MNVNTMSKRFFLMLQLFLSVCIAFLFRRICFSCLLNRNVSTSLIVYWGIVVFLTGGGCLLSYKRQRNGFSVMANAVIPVGVYVVLCYGRYFTPVYWILLGIGALLIAVFGVAVFLKRTGKPLSQVLKRRLARFLYGAKNIAAVFMAIITLLVGITTLLQIPMYKTSIDPSVSDDGPEEWTIKSQMDSVSKLAPDVWGTLSLEERQEVLGVVRNIETAYLGLTQPVDLGFSVLKPYELGEHSHSLHQITLDLRHLDEDAPERVLHTLFHEMYHAYEHEQVEMLAYVPDEYQDLLLFTSIHKYKDELAAYVDGAEDYDAYEKQTLEVMANRYADYMVTAYYNQIEEFNDNAAEQS